MKSPQNKREVVIEHITKALKEAGFVLYRKEGTQINEYSPEEAMLVIDITNNNQT